MSSIRVFASHDWGTDAQTHKRVSVVVDELRRRGIDVWFDETHMKRNILDAMCQGIDSADVVLVFVTANYIRKVESGNGSDNVRREFMYAKDRPEKLLAVRFDASLPSKWSGPVGMVLGSQLYVDLTSDGTPERVVAPLVEAIRRCSPKTHWKTAVKKAHLLPVATPSRARVASRAEADAVARAEAALLAVPLAPKRLPARQRVGRVLEEMGDCLGEDEHTGDALQRLLESLVGSKAVPDTFHEKLTLAEQQLGLTAS